MKNLIKNLTLVLALTSFTSIYSQQFNIVYNNTSTYDVRVIVFDASNNALGGSFLLAAGTSGTVPGGCRTGTPTLIHFIETDAGCGLGGCLWPANLNTSGSCSTCTSCNCWSTASPVFSNTFTASTVCQPISNELSITITN
jgi:hypothetical protein